VKAIASIVEQEKKQSQTWMIYFEFRAPSLISPPSQREGHYPIRIFSQISLHKGIIMVYIRLEYTTLTLNPLHKRQHKANEVYKFFVTTKITNNLFYNFLYYLMWDGAKEVCKRENQLKWINLRAKNLQKLVCKW